MCELATSPRVRRMEDGDTPLPGLKAFAGSGHTPGHLLFMLEANPVPILFTGDAAKNRAELLCRDVDLTLDRASSVATIDRIWSLWKARAGTLLIPGHDLSMVLDADGKPQYVGKREAAIGAWFGESIEHMTSIDLCCPPSLMGNTGA